MRWAKYDMVDGEEHGGGQKCSQSPFVAGGAAVVFTQAAADAQSMKQEALRARIAATNAHASQVKVLNEQVTSCPIGDDR